MLQTGLCSGLHCSHLLQEQSSVAAVAVCSPDGHRVQRAAQPAQHGDLVEQQVAEVAPCAQQRVRARLARRHTG